MDFFKNYLKWGRTYYDWLLDTDFIKKEELHNHYTNLIKSCNEFKITSHGSLDPIFESHRTKFRDLKKI